MSPRSRLLAARNDGCARRGAQTAAPHRRSWRRSRTAGWKVSTQSIVNLEAPSPTRVISGDGTPTEPLSVAPCCAGYGDLVSLGRCAPLAPVLPLRALSRLHEWSRSAVRIGCKRSKATPPMTGTRSDCLVRRPWELHRPCQAFAAPPQERLA